jgi:hypothetical protein
MYHGAPLLNPRPALEQLACGEGLAAEAIIRIVVLRKMLPCQLPLLVRYA